MKLSKKILAFLLPVTTVSTMAVAVTTSCSCNSESFSFIYGDPINCWKKMDQLPNTTVHSLNIVKSESKKHLNLWTQDTVKTAELTTYVNDSHNVYFDLIASLSNNGNKQFGLKWTEKSDKTIDIYAWINNNEAEISLSSLTLGTDIKYEKTTEVGKNDIMLNISKGGTTSISVKSFVFNGITIKD